MKRAVSSRRGQGVVEYVLLIILIGLVALMATDKVGVQVNRFYNDASGQVGAVAGSN